MILHKRQGGAKLLDRPPPVACGASTEAARLGILKPGRMPSMRPHPLPPVARRPNALVLTVQPTADGMVVHMTATSKNNSIVVQADAVTREGVIKPQCMGLRLALRPVSAAVVERQAAQRQPDQLHPQAAMEQTDQMDVRNTFSMEELHHLAPQLARHQ